ncbi:MAG TPA: hypothetical protein VN442_21915 [Bryobacteraceae bacterium]|nr:hypothetical protein [Bryobacteraceae bacterium]
MITRLLLLSGLAVLLSAQPRAVEVYAQTGVLGGGGDEGWAGRAGSWGGALTVPLVPRLALDLDFQSARFARDFGSQGSYFRTRRWLISPALLYRFGNERVYGFAGGGLGAELNRSVSIESNFLPGYQPPGWQEISPGVWKATHSSRDRTVHARGGFVISPVRHLVIRVDVHAGWVYVLPNLGVKVGVGYRF